MKHYPRKSWALALSAGLLTGCLSSGDHDRTAGAQDFPNSLKAIGSLTSLIMDRSAEWSRLDTLGNHIAAPTLPILPPLAKSALAKFSSQAAGDSIRWDFSDTSQGTATVYFFKDDSLVSVHDTLIVRYDAQAKDALYGNETVVNRAGETFWKILATAFRYQVTDTDSDGLLDWRRLSVLPSESNGIATSLIFTERPGPDGNFELSGDNLSIALEIVKKTGGDTLVYDKYFDVDGDGSLWSGKLSDSALIEYTQIRAGDSALPGVIRSQFQVRGAVFSSGSGRVELRKAFLQEKLRTGGVKTARIWGIHPDSTFKPGDTAYVTVGETIPPPDTLSHYEARFQILTSHPSEPGPGDVMLSFTAQCLLRKGTLAGAELAFRPDAPQLPVPAHAPGSIGMTVDLRPEGKAQVTARHSAEGVQGEVRFTGPTHGTYQVIWDSQGKLHSYR